MYTPNDERIYDELRAGAPVAHLRDHSLHLHWLACERRGRLAHEAATRGRRRAA